MSNWVWEWIIALAVAGLALYGVYYTIEKEKECYQAGGARIEGLLFGWTCSVPI